MTNLLTRILPTLVFGLLCSSSILAETTTLISVTESQIDRDELIEVVGREYLKTEETRQNFILSVSNIVNEIDLMSDVNCDLPTSYLDARDQLKKNEAGFRKKNPLLCNAGL